MGQGGQYSTHVEVPSYAKRGWALDLWMEPRSRQNRSLGVHMSHRLRAMGRDLKQTCLAPRVSVQAVRRFLNFHDLGRHTDHLNR